MCLDARALRFRRARARARMTSLVTQIGYEQFNMNLYGRRTFGLDTRMHLLFEHAHRIQSGAERIGR